MADAVKDAAALPVVICRPGKMSSSSTLGRLPSCRSFSSRSASFFASSPSRSW
jgi:hypothetical protein